MDVGFFNCTKCDKVFKNELGLLRHLNNHGINVEMYMLDKKHGGVRPTCKCGCGEITKYGPELRDYRAFVPGHQSRVNNNFQTEKSKTNSKATKAKIKELGLWKDKDSEETRQKKSESHHGEKNHMFGKHHKESTIELISEAKKEYFENNPEAKQANGDRSREYWSTDEAKQKQRERYFIGGDAEQIANRHFIGEEREKEKLKKTKCVYLIALPLKEEVLYKIGYTTRGPYSRMEDIQRNIPIALSIKTTYESEVAKKLEKELHSFFISKKRMGEWFALSSEEANSFEQVCQQLEKIIK